MVGYTIIENSKKLTNERQCKTGQLQSGQADPREFGQIYCSGVHELVNVCINARKKK